jgi:signal peptidase I
LIESTQETNDGVEQAAPVLPSGHSIARNPVAEWAFTILIMLFASTSLGWSYVIPTGSMEDTLLVGDHIFVDKLAYSPGGRLAHVLLPYQDPKDGDIIAFHYPADPAQMFVKRVIGQPGDRIRIVNQKLYRNGAAVREPYVFHKAPFFSAYRDNFPMDMAWLDVAPDARRNALLREMLDHHVKDGELVVPPENYFAMGDNRDNSLDSRYWGFVPRDNIVGKPVLIFWSYDASTSELMPNSSGDMLRHMLSVGEHFLTRTRWNRTFRLVRPYEIANETVRR